MATVDNTRAIPNGGATSEVVNTKNYQLKKTKAIKKKLQACDRDDVTSITQTHGGTKILFRAGIYEIFREAVETYYTQQPTEYSIKMESDEDKDGLQTARRFKVTVSNTSNYTLNLYHTTCTALINGRGELIFVNSDLPKIMGAINQTNQVGKLNEEIRNALLKLAPEDESETKCIKCKKNCQSRAVLCSHKQHWVHYHCEKLSAEQIEEVNKPTHLMYRCNDCSSELARTQEVMITQDQGIQSMQDMDNSPGNCPEEADRTIAEEETTTLMLPWKDPIEETSIQEDEPKSCTKPSTCTKPSEPPEPSSETTNNKETTPNPTPPPNPTPTPTSSILGMTLDKSDTGTEKAKEQHREPSHEAIGGGHRDEMSQSQNEISNNHQQTITEHITVAAMKSLEDHLIEMRLALTRVEEHISINPTHIPNPTKENKETRTISTQTTNDDDTPKETITRTFATQTLTSDKCKNTNPDGEPTDLLSRVKELEKELQAISNDMKEQMKQRDSDIAELKQALTTQRSSYASVVKEPAPVVKEANKHQKRNGPSSQTPSHEIWFKGKGDPLSNLFPCKVFVFNRWYESSEHAYQHTKADYHNKKENSRNIMLTKDPAEATRIGRSIKTTREWKEDKENVMLTILRAKEEHCHHYRNRLRDTHLCTLHEDTTHPFWGGRVGKNHLGRLHMRIRDEIRSTQDTNNNSNINDNNSNNNNNNTNQYPGYHMDTPTVTIIGDSNTRGLDPSKMTKKYNFQVKQAMTGKDLLAKVKEERPRDQTMVIHTGTNDLKNQSAEETANSIVQTASTLLRNGNKVIVSYLLPREGLSLNNKVVETNYILYRQLRGKVHFTATNNFYYQDRPNKDFFRTEFREGHKLPLLHLNKKGLCELSRQIQHAVKKSAMSGNGDNN